VKLDRVIVASDFSPQFLNFWPLVAKSWVTTFGLKPTLALIANHPVGNTDLERLRKYGDVYFHRSSSSAPIANQAKMFRWFLAAKFKSEFVTIEDIDTVYLKSDYLRMRLESLKPGKLLGIGDDVNQDDISYRGKFPASNLTGKSEIFAEFFHLTSEKTFESFLESFRNMCIFDLREDPFNNPHNFSDESLIRALRSFHARDIIETIPRGVDIHTAWMDRSWWPSEGQIPDGAILANMPRPLYNNQKKCSELISLHFPDGYPWIFPRRSRFWENPDSRIQIVWRLLEFRIHQKRNSIKPKLEEYG